MLTKIHAGLVLFGIVALGATACGDAELDEETGSDTSTLSQSPFVTLRAVTMRTKTVGSRACNDTCWNLNQNGYVEDTVTFPSGGRFAFDVTAFAWLAQNVGARMELRIDGKAVASTTVRSKTMVSHLLEACVTAGRHRVAIAFTNDFYRPSTGEDRNLFVGEVRIRQQSTTCSGTTPPPTSTPPTPPPTSTTTPPPVTQPPPGTVSFASDWDKDPVKGGWGSRQAVRSSSLGRDSNVKTWHGHAAARVQVGPGDDPINSTGERAEVLLSVPENSSSGTQYYGMSYLFPTTWAATGKNSQGTGWSVIFQLHGPDNLGASPSFALSADSQFLIESYAGDLNNAARRTFTFSNGSLSKGKWVDLVIRLQHSASNNGRIVVYRRDEGQASFTKVVDQSNVPTLQYRGSVGTHYWKQGLYRGEIPNRTDVLWMGPSSRATTFLAAEAAAFGTQSGEPN